MRKSLFILFILSLANQEVLAQYSLRTNLGGNASFEKYYVNPPLRDSATWSDPKRATVMSAILPGSGQLYNRSYLKAGILYAGVIALGYAFNYNVDSLKVYQRALVYRIDGDENTEDLVYTSLSDAQVLQERNFYRRNRDILILSFVGLYALQIIDANVDAHLKEFKINKDLAFTVRPKINYEPIQQGFSTRISLGFRF